MSRAGQSVTDTPRAQQQRQVLPTDQTIPVDVDARQSWVRATPEGEYHRQVRSIDRSITGDIGNVEHLFADRWFHFEQRDVTEYIHVPGNLDAILHFASPASPIDYLELPIQTLKVGSLGTHKRAVGAARRSSGRPRAGGPGRQAGPGA